MAFTFLGSAGEALVLGLATGPVCLASCGPVVLPWMLAQPEGVRAHSRQLSVFLAARLLGYLVFAAAAWCVGTTIPRAWSGRSWIFGGVELLLAVVLVVYAVGWPRRRCSVQASSGELVQIGERPRERRSGAVSLGFLTGVNLCPPFLVAGVRAAQQANLLAALVFFLFFFVGTAVWFLPFLSLGLVRRTPTVVTVARMVAVLLACWYLFSGVSILIGRPFH